MTCVGRPSPDVLPLGVVGWEQLFVFARRAERETSGQQRGSGFIRPERRGP